MTPEQFVNVISALLAAGLLVWVLYGPWQTFVIDMTRQALFSLRDEVFDLAATGKLSFESGEYRQTREDFNQLIRFCHSLTWVRLLAHRFTAERDSPRISITEHIETIEDPEVRDAVKDRIVLGYYAVFGMIWLRSPFLVLVSPVALLVVLPVVVMRLQATRIGNEFASQVHTDACHS